MRIATGFAFALASVGSVLYFLPLDAPPQHSAERVAPAVHDASKVVLQRGPAERPAALTPRVFSPDKPLVRDQQPATAFAPVATYFIAPVAPKLADPGQRKLSSSRPADEDARRELVRDLQRELKRVGCFEGEATGTWGPTTKKAMTAFTERVNATLPLDEPDYILLTLVQGHAAPACGKSCPSEQAMNEDGKCLPRAIIAQKVKRSANKVALADAPTPKDLIERPANEKVKLRSGTAASTATTHPQDGTRLSSVWSTVVTETPSAAAPSTRNLPPLPGRMAIGAPVEVIASPQGATAAQAEAERTKFELARRKATLAQAERNATADADRQRRIGEAESRRAYEAMAVKKSHQASLDTAAKRVGSEQFAAVDNGALANEGSGVNAPAPAVESGKPPMPPIQLSEKRIKQGQINRTNANPPDAVIAQSTAAYRLPAPRFGSAPYGIGRIASAASRPSYAPEPRRWTRTIFTDIARMR